MKTKFEYFTLALSGAFLVLVPLYIQGTSIDLSHHSFAKNVAADIKIWAWWTVVGLPLIVGIVYLGAAIYGLKSNMLKKKSLILISGCFLLGCLLSLVSGFGYIAAILSAISCLSCFAKPNHELRVTRQD